MTMVYCLRNLLDVSAPSVCDILRSGPSDTQHWWRRKRGRRRELDSNLVDAIVLEVCLLPRRWATPVSNLVIKVLATAVIQRRGQKDWLQGRRIGEVVVQDHYWGCRTQLVKRRAYFSTVNYGHQARRRKLYRKQNPQKNIFTQLIYIEVRKMDLWNGAKDQWLFPLEASSKFKIVFKNLLVSNWFVMKLGKGESGYHGNNLSFATCKESHC